MVAAKICCHKIAVGSNQKLFGAPNEKQNGESGRAIVEDGFEFFVNNFETLSDAFGLAQNWVAFCY